MSELKTNKISTNDQNNVAIDNALGLKSYDTTGRDALTSVAGDMIYNTTDSKVQVYNGSSWEDLGGLAAATVDYLVIAGGGSGGSAEGVYNFSGGGGAGGYRNSYASETSGNSSSTESSIAILKGTNYEISIGAGGAGDYNSTTPTARNGVDTYFGPIISLGGCSGGGVVNGGWRPRDTFKGGSGGGAGEGATKTLGTVNQGGDGGVAAENGAGGGAGASGNGSDGSNGYGGNGANGLSSSITGTAVTRAGGGGGTGIYTHGTGGTGGATSGSINSSSAAATINTGSGSGGSSRSSSGTLSAGNGGSGVVILRWATADATIGATRTGLVDGDVQTDGSDSYIVFTGGTGTITFS